MVSSLVQLANQYGHSSLFIVKLKNPQSPLKKLRGWPLFSTLKEISLRRPLRNRHHQQSEHKHMQGCPEPQHIGLNPALLVDQTRTRGCVHIGDRHDSLKFVFDMPKIEVVGTPPR